MIIERYIFKELSKTFLLATLILTSVFFIDKILFLTELIVNRGVSLFNVAKLLSYALPSFLILTIPMAVLISSLITFNTLSSHGEIIALRAGGVSFFKTISPLIIFSFFTYLLANILIFALLPQGNFAFKKLIFNIVRNKANYELKERVFNDDFEGLIIYFNEKPRQENIFKEIFISDSRSPEKSQIIYAREGILSLEPDQLSVILELKEGTLHRLSEDKKEYQFLSFSSYNMALRLVNNPFDSGTLTKDNREMSIKELQKKISHLKEEGKPYFKEQVEIYKKYSLTFTCLLIGLIGAPLGVFSGKSGKLGGFTLSLGIILIYYLLLMGGESLGSEGKINPILAVWLPNLILMATSGFLLHKTNQ